MGTSQVSPGGRCLWTEHLIPSILFKPPHSPSCWTSEAGMVAAHPLGLCGEAQTWYHVRGQSSGDCEAPRKESHITLLHTHRGLGGWESRHRSPQEPAWEGAVGWRAGARLRTPSKCLARSRPLTKLRHCGLQPPRPLTTTRPPNSLLRAE